MSFIVMARTAQQLRLEYQIDQPSYKAIAKCEGCKKETTLRGRIRKLVLIAIGMVEGYMHRVCACTVARGCAIAPGYADREMQSLCNRECGIDASLIKESGHNLLKFNRLAALLCGVNYLRDKVSL
jgi:hypothetical protein